MAYTNIDDPSAHFQVETYTGNSTSPRSITLSGNSDMQPDWTWIKTRAGPYYHYLFDSSRYSGSSYYRLISSETNSDYVDTVSQLTAFNTDGFTLAGSGSMANVNWSTQNYVAWNWKANGGTTASNTDGNTTTTVQANQDAGFSIVTYTGTGSSSQTMGHGLGVTPNIVLTKNRSGTGRAWSFNGNFGGLIYGTNKLILNQTSALTADTNDITAASSATFTGGGSNGTNANGVTYVAYCFAEKQGYSKFGKYTGNGNANGSFIYTGFKPAVVINKRTDGAGPWTIFDNARCPNNVNNAKLYPHTNDAEVTTTGDPIDFLSNGYKLRGSGSDCNVNGGSYIYMAFAENPFTTSTGIPTTAR